MSKFESHLFFANDCVNASLIADEDESRVSFSFRIGGIGWCIIPLIALIFFHISEEQELDFIELVYCCQDSVLYFLIIYLDAARDSLRLM